MSNANRRKAPAPTETVDEPQNADVAVVADDAPVVDDGPLMGAVEYATTSPAHRQIPFSGLLVASPELRDENLSRAAWDEHLSTYLASPRP